MLIRSTHAEFSFILNSDRIDAIKITSAKENTSDGIFAVEVLFTSAGQETARWQILFSSPSRETVQNGFNHICKLLEPKPRPKVSIKSPLK